MNRKIANSRRLASIQAYLVDNKSLREKSKELGVHYTTLFRWIKRYKKGGAELLNRHYQSDNRRNTLPNEIKESIVTLKEERPAITIQQAKEIFNTNGIKVSTKKIWQIWREYGFIGFKKEKFANNFRLYIPKDAKLLAEAQRALKYLGDGDIKKAANIVNSLPYCPEDDVLNKIPDRYLNLRRRVEKLPLIMGSESYPRIRRRCRRLRIQLEKRKLYYSALRAGIMELLCSGWIGDPKYQLSLANHLEDLAGLSVKDRFSDIGLLLTVLIYKGRAYAGILKFRVALEYAMWCKKILRSRHAPNIKRTLSTLFGAIGLFKEALNLLAKAREECTEDYEKENCDLLIALYESLKGNHNAALRKIQEARNIRSVATISSFSLVKARCALGMGNLQEAQEFATLALNQSQETGLRTNLNFSSLILASIYMYYGEKRKAYALLTRFNSLFAKYGMQKYVIYRSLLTDAPADNLVSNNEISLNPELNLLLLLKDAAQTRKFSDYNKAYLYAKRMCITGILHQCIPFYVDLVLSLQNKGRTIYLPRALLRLPIFNKEAPVYYIKFLGDLVVFKNQKYLKTRLKPKDTAFLIYLCQKAMEPKKFVNLDEVYANFWPKSEKASRNFSHLLVRLKKALKIPTHLFEISRAMGNPILINHGVYFTTDYQEFEQTLARAKALERAGEWGFARKEYLRAFKLFRGEPFKKNFDNWSVDMRFKILSEFETEAINFAKSCIEHGNKNDARKILQKVLRIIPDSEEARKLSDSLI